MDRAVGAMKDGGRLIPPDLEETFQAAYRAANPWAMMVKGRKLTRRERIRAHINGAHWRVSTAIDVLRGRHRCGDE